MITKPSINDLIVGLAQNLEQMAGDASKNDLTLLFTPVLTVLDRLGNEWAGWSALLIADNDDIRATLNRLDVNVQAAYDSSPLASADAPRLVERLEEENRHLKSALIGAIETFDLPAGEHATETQKRADREILTLLRRMLYREDQVGVSPSRVAPTSGNPKSATVSLENLSTVLTQFINEQLRDAEGVTLEKLRPLAGGASREAWIFDVRWRQGGTAHFEECILMREPHSSVLVSDESPTVINGTRRTVATEIGVIARRPRQECPFHTCYGPTTKVFGSSDRFRLRGGCRAPPTRRPSSERRSAQKCSTSSSRYSAACTHSIRTPTVSSVLGRPTATVGRHGPGAAVRTQLPRATSRTVSRDDLLIRWLKKHQPVASRVSWCTATTDSATSCTTSAASSRFWIGSRPTSATRWKKLRSCTGASGRLTSMCPIDEFVERYESATGTVVDRASLAYYRVFIEFKMLVVLFTSLKSYFSTRGVRAALLQRSEDDSRFAVARHRRVAARGTYRRIRRVRTRSRRPWLNRTSTWTSLLHRLSMDCC